MFKAHLGLEKCQNASCLENSQLVLDWKQAFQHGKFDIST